MTGPAPATPLPDTHEAEGLPERIVVKRLMAERNQWDGPPLIGHFAYVRADLYDAALADLARLREEAEMARAIERAARGLMAEYVAGGVSLTALRALEDALAPPVLDEEAGG